MREEFPGFYRPTNEEFAALWDTGLIVPDSNVLLALYELTETTRGKLLQIFEALGDRLFLPHQVAFEFQKRRVAVIDEQKQAYKKVEDQVGGFARQTGAKMSRHPRLDKAELEKRIENALKPVEEYLSEIRADHPDPLSDGDAIGSDAVRDKLDEIFVGRLGEPRDVDALVEVGKERYERKQPPGYEDEKKDEPDRYGDLAIWLDMVDRAQSEQRGVIFVTEERKEDWWWKQGSETFAPRRELVEEMRREAGQQVYLYGLKRFMDHAAEKLDIDLSDDDRDDAARAGDAAAAKSFVMLGSGNWISSPSPDADNLILTSHPHNSANTMWPASPASGFTTYPASGGPFMNNIWTTPLANQRHRWDTMVEEKGAEAVLRVAWEPFVDRFGSGTFLCQVTTPDNRRIDATITSTDLTASVDFPADFPIDGPLDPGSYAYAWYYEPAGTNLFSQVASGGFNLVPEEGNDPAS